ncbi:DUF7660 family protein [Hwanghaeella sp. LZ110]|uniref:DUF7660 family protein n=1 Tax=Hwanghaeella sp. LZ110 TaxID=3402810 RepID=UPI003B66B17A
MTPDEEEFIKEKLKRLTESVQTHHDLANFIAELLHAYENGYFEEQDVVEYLNGFWGLTRALDSWSRNVGYGSEAPEQPDWRWVARLLHGAFHHS